MTSADDTRRRILAAATAEFAMRGIAGARVDRIAQASGSSKPMLYAYFGGKEQLFDAVFAGHVIANSDRVPFTADDLPGYAARLYDDYLADPDLPRLIAWKRLERVSRGYLYEGLEANDEAHLRDIEVQQRQGTIRPDLDPVDVWSLLISAASTWAQVAVTEVADSDEPLVVHRRRKKSLSDTVRLGLCQPSPSTVTSNP